MYRRIEFAPKSPFHDIEGTVSRIRAQHPGITDAGVSQVVAGLLKGSKPRRIDNVTVVQDRPGYKARTKGRVVHLYGADILTADVMAIPAWGLLGDGEKSRLIMHPINGGLTIPDDLEGPKRREAQEQLVQNYAPRGVNRSVLISPQGLQQTYVWRLSNDWIQEVTDHDYDLLLSTADRRNLFRDPDIKGPYVPARSYYAGEARDQAVANSMREVDYLVRQQKRRPHWQGADVSE